MRQNRRRGTVVIIVLVAILFVVALLLTRNAQTAGASPASFEPVSSGPPVSSEPVRSEPASSKPEAKAIPAAMGEYDLEGLPPLFNYDNPIPDSYELNLLDIGGGQQMQAGAAEAFLAMQAAAAADGITLSPLSGFRNYETQANNFNNSIQSKIAGGMSEEEATAATKSYYAIPGTSEHEAGLAIDINLVEDSFDQTPAFEWLQEHCTEYGFIFRYRQEAVEITHIAYEPWHYRYVGANHATAIEKEGVTLEEYIQSFS